MARALYPPKERSLEVMAEDMKRYAAALAKTGSKVSRFEPVSTITGRYEADLDLPTAAAEVGLPPQEFVQRIDGSETLAKHVGSLRAAGGTVSRQIWVQAFGDHVRELQLGGRAQHAVRPLAAQLATCDLESVWHHGAEGGERHEIADRHVERAAADLERLTVTGVHVDELDLVGVGMTPKIEHPRDAIIKVNRGKVDAIVQVGTNLAMGEVAAMAEFWLGKPVIAINTATYWYALRQYGIKDKVYGWGSLLAEH